MKKALGYDDPDMKALGKLNKGIREEHGIAKYNSKHVPSLADGGQEEPIGVSAYDLYTTPHCFVKVSKPMVAAKGAGYGSIARKR